jgi:hypothetical protein
MKKTFVAMAVVVFMVLPFVSCNKQNAKNNEVKIEETEKQAEEKPEPVQEDVKTLYVSESLRLRKSESTDSEIIATMIIGTEVEIMETGKADTIGGVDGNWVKVKVINDVKDLKGNNIQGLFGWCFDGYLIEDATRFGLIGDWDNESYSVTFKSNGDFSLGRKESEGMSGKWELKEKKILLTELQVYDEEPTNDEWQLVNLDAKNLQVVWNGRTEVFTRAR